MMNAKETVMEIPPTDLNAKITNDSTLVERISGR